MPLQRNLKWVEPLEMAGGIPESEKYWVLLYSGMQMSFTGDNSILALCPKEHIKADDFNKLQQKLSSDKGRFENAWFGYMAYGLKNSLEKLPKDEADYITFPDLWMSKYSLILHFDHSKKILTAWAESEEFFANIPQAKKQKNMNKVIVENLSSNMSKQSYLDKVTEIQEKIASGDIYQANLTRKFAGRFKNSIYSFELFKKLCSISPAPYSSFMRLDDSFILSSSPERFISVKPDGSAESRPIKGSAARADDDKDEDEAIREQLAASEKDRAENLMIVDLMRNDLSRSCIAGSIKVPKLYEIDSYATVHHMSSVVQGQKQPALTALDVVARSFPPGSMTGTPKIKAMEICSAMEKQGRGVYSGAIGWFGGDGAADLSVVIRTLIIQRDKFEFQVGGAIVADSTPEEEWRETMIKAKAITAALGISIAELESL